MDAGNRLVNWALFGTLSLIWGSSFILMKVGMQTLTPYQVAAIRILSGGLVLLPVAVKQFKKIPSNKLSLVFLSGLLGSFFPAFLFCVAESRIESALTGILNALTPIFTIISGVLFFGIRVPLARLAGTGIGFLGVSLLFVSGASVPAGDISYAGLVIIATACYGLNVNLVSRYLQDVGSLNIASVAFAFLILPCLLVLVFTGYFRLPLTQPGLLVSTGASAILGIMGTAVASVFFYMLVKRAGILFTSMVTYAIPFVAIGWGLWYGERITLPALACLLIILSGVYLVNRRLGTVVKQP